MRKRIIATAVISASLVCSSFSFAVQAEEAAQTQAEMTEELKTIGEKQENDYKLEIKNNSGKDVRALAVSVDKKEFGSSLLAANDTWKDQETRMLYVTPEKVKNADGTEQNKQDAVYDVRITFTDNSVVTLHDFPLRDAETAELKLEDKIGYLVYPSLTLQAEKNTLEAEKNPGQTQTVNSSSQNTGTAADSGTSQNTQQAQASSSAGSDSSDTGSGSSYSEDNSYNESYDSSYDSYDSSGDYDYDYDYDYEDSSDSGSEGCLDDGIILN